MWWRSAALAAFMIAPALAGCGFHPLYSKSGKDPLIVEELASIQVDPLRDRQGQLVHNALIKLLNPEGAPGDPHYHLQVAYQITESQQALRTDDTATRDVLYYNVLYRLYEGPTAVTAGTFHQTFSYDFLQEHYANVSSQEDIKRRAADAIAGEVRNRLAAYFTNAATQREAAK